MPRRSEPYPAAYRGILELIRHGRTPEELAQEFEPTANTIRSWVKQAQLDGGQRTDGLTTDEKAELIVVRFNSGLIPHFA